MALFNQLTVALIDIDSLMPSSWSADNKNLISPGELQRLHEKGAVGNLCLRFYNAGGEEIKDVVGDRVLGLELRRLRGIATVVGIACGRRKRQAILGALRG